MVFQNRKSSFFEFVEVFRKDPLLGLLGRVLFFPLINNFSASVPSVSCSLYVDDLAV